MAIERHVAVAFEPTEGPHVRVWSEHFKEEAVFRSEELAPGRIKGWAAYPAGMCWAMHTRGHEIGGMQAAIVADIPVGAGVSSSAALEVSFGLAVSEANGLELRAEEIAENSHVADNEFVGIPSGIMDQYASALCRRGHALLIDCRTTAAESVPLPGNVVFVVMDTGKRRGLVDSEYGDRVAACRRVTAIIRERRPGVVALRDVTVEDLDLHRASIDDADYRRALHVIAENDRTLEGVRRLRVGDGVGFGKLMSASHDSLRDLYEVSCPELDAAVESAQKHPACLGARMTGGGFGGCALALVEAPAVDHFVSETAKEYERRTSREGSIFEAHASAGVRLEITTNE